MKALVTGANGLIGASLARHLLEQGATVRGVVRPGANLTALAGVDVELHAVAADDDSNSLVAAARGCTHVFHTAMHFTYDRAHADSLDAAAIRGTENVLRAAQAAGVPRVVVTSSSVVFGYALAPGVKDETSPLDSESYGNPYVDAKTRQHTRALELGEELGIEVVAVCPTVTVGPHATRLGPSNGLIVAYLADPLRATFTGGCNVTAATDVAAGHRLAAEHGTPGGAYILGSENLEWRSVHAIVAELAGVDAPRVVLNHTLAYLAATFEEGRARIGRRAPLSNRVQAGMVGRYYWYDDSKARALGYSPRPARTAVAEALAWLAASRHVSRALRCSLRLHDDVYAARDAQADDGAKRAR